jgi:hypothetical protein
MVTLEKIKKLFEAFDHPFLPNGFVEARIVHNDGCDPIMNIRIGDRDLSFTEDGTFMDQGTNVGDAVEWTVRKGKTICNGCLGRAPKEEKKHTCHTCVDCSFFTRALYRGDCMKRLLFVILFVCTLLLAGGITKIRKRVTKIYNIVTTNKRAISDMEKSIIDNAKALNRIEKMVGEEIVQ